MSLTTTLFHPARRLLTATIWLLCGLLAVPLVAQESKGGKDSAPGKGEKASKDRGTSPATAPVPKVQAPLTPSAFRFYSLRNRDANETVALLQKVWEGAEARFFVDAETDLVIGYGDRAVLQEAETLIEKLQTAGAERAAEQAEQTAILQFANLELSANAKVEEAIENMQAAYRASAISLDPTNNRVIVHGSKDALAAYEKLVRGLDRRETSVVKDRALQVRVVWLAAGLERKDAPRPHDDIRAAVAELDKRGVDADDLRVVAQAVVTTITGSEAFSVDTRALADRPCEFTVRGEVLAAQESSPTLKIRLQASETDPSPVNSPKRLYSLETTIKAPIGQYLVFGMAPIDKATSVFVVQVTAKQ